MENITDKIDRYLDGTMSADEASAFEKEISSDPQLQQQIYVQKNLRAGIERVGMKSTISTQFKKATLQNKIYKWGITTVAVAAVATAVYYGAQQMNSTDGPEITYELPALNEQGTTQWSDADRNLPTQVFHINPNKDTVIETQNGIVFAIPAGAFVGAEDPFTLEIREAITPMDIMKGGLSTTSNGELLETGGMFYINARNGETSLKINAEKPVYANVPTNEIKPGMMLFEGERRPDGSINWKNPKPMEKQLIPVDIFSLNFYPEGFLEKVAELGFDANNKKVTDSIYYSYSGRIAGLASPPLFGEDDISAIDGKALFKTNCQSCHSASSKRSTGPGLRGVLDRIPAGNWKYDYIHNPSALILKGDPYANKIFNDYNKTTMTAFPQLSNAEIDAILMYINTGPDERPVILEIDPARISGIWNEKFQNTIIATKQFEERLQVIFKHCSVPYILDFYVENLDKPLYEIDSLVYDQYRLAEFQEFYQRREGGVNISQPHMKQLQEYFLMKQRASQLAAESIYEKRIQDEKSTDSTYQAIAMQQSSDEINGLMANFQKEFEINLADAYRQLGVTPSANAYYGLLVNTPGWKNVDLYVMESTINRSTLDYTDPLTRKKAVIKYEPLNVTVENSSNYQQLFVYLVSDSLPTFRKLEGYKGKYPEKLDELLSYSLVVIAEKDGKWFWETKDKIKPSSIQIKLKEIPEEKLRQELSRMFVSNLSTDLGKEITAMKATRKYKIQMTARKKQQQIDEEIQRVIFPCSDGNPFGAGNGMKPAPEPHGRTTM
jgi:cytochrome c2